MSFVIESQKSNLYFANELRKTRPFLLYSDAYNHLLVVRDMGDLAAVGVAEKDIPQFYLLHHRPGESVGQAQFDLIIFIEQEFQR